ncbi:MAG TPA: NAD-dependent epimerase/dehydratase family protein [Actinomycetota bacterium]|jgi:UDP-glucose 4-epimerase|nr:NAD-dependent epimerase/dehydratase family protein [Actinomycetota bacterium]
MKTVAVTGASGYLGRKVVERLGADADVSRVIGVDVVEPSYSTRNLEFYNLDVRSSELGEVIADCGALVHLADVNTKDPAETHDVNVTGTRAAMAAAARSGIHSVVFSSSHTVYGHHADNDYPLTEESPVRPHPSSAYPMSKAEAERVVNYFADAHPDVAVATLRFAWIGGPGLPANPAIESPVRLVIRGYAPESQAVHEDDAADAVLFALRNELRGTYNVCADDTVARQEDVYGQRRVSVGAEAAKRLFDRTSKLGLTVPAGEIGALMYPQVMSNARIRGAGFAFERSSADAMREAAAARKDWVALGRARFRPRRAALIGGTFGAVLLGSAFRKRRPKPESD